MMVKSFSSPRPISSIKYRKPKKNAMSRILSRRTIFFRLLIQLRYSKSSLLILFGVAIRIMNKARSKNSPRMSGTTCQFAQMVYTRVKTQKI